VAGLAVNGQGRMAAVRLIWEPRLDRVTAHEQTNITNRGVQRHCTGVGDAELQLYLALVMRSSARALRLTSSEQPFGFE
jgi:hypothetical protein